MAVPLGADLIFRRKNVAPVVTFFLRKNRLDAHDAHFTALGGQGDFASAFSDVFEDLFGDFMGGRGGAGGRAILRTRSSGTFQKT